MPIPTITCDVRPARPRALATGTPAPVTLTLKDNRYELANGYVAAEIAPAGAIIAITNRVTGERFELQGDQTGMAIWTGADTTHRWLASAMPRDSGRPVTVTAPGAPLELPAAGHGQGVAFATQHTGSPDCAAIDCCCQWPGLTICLRYELRRDQFWLERRLRLLPAENTPRLNRLVYGRLATAGGGARVLELGRFDRPRLVSERGKRGGLFGGVGWWFYSITEEGVYHNADLDFPLTGPFESAPWYVGVFAPEAGEPYAGWAWYKAFLEDRKRAHDTHKSWRAWNLGWGMPGVDINHASAPQHFAFAARLGLEGAGLGSGGYGQGLPKYVELQRTDPTAQANLAAATARGLAIGFLDHGGDRERWADPARLTERLTTLADYVAVGYSAIHMDFLSVADTFAAHRALKRYLRAAHAATRYTECHLGMATYGPQLQREVILNHPTDLHAFSLRPLSSDWCTFMGFRASRREWQQRYEYLMPEYGLYYFVTHYMNPGGELRRYTDPEPQQFITRIPAYTGIGFNFHDRFGFRQSLLGAAAFTTYPVMGYLDLTMPDTDVAFARAALDWQRDHADALRPARLAFEDATVGVVSKLVGDAGLIFVLNYQPGRRAVRLRLTTEIPGTFRVRQVFPVAGEAATHQDGDTLALTLPGESVVVLEVGALLRSLPPSDQGGLNRDLEADEWRAAGRSLRTTFLLPARAAGAAALADPKLPAELVSMEQTGPAAFPLTPDGKLPALFLDAYEFADAQRVATWKVVPWACAARVWLTWCPAEPPLLGAPTPRVVLNGHALRLYPRIDTRTGNPRSDPRGWTCPLFVADISAALLAGSANTLTVTGLPRAALGVWTVRAAAGSFQD